MTTKEIGTKLVELCKANKNAEAMQTLYATDIVSVEAGAPPGQEATQRGLPACLAKGKHWVEAHEVHSAKVEGPFPHGDRFAVMFDYDITRRADNKRFQMKEVALYTVANDKITREEFFYSM
jgi:ketosteroid isomerase-like protein